MSIAAALSDIQFDNVDDKRETEISQKQLLIAVPQDV